MIRCRISLLTLLMAALLLSCDSQAQPVVVHRPADASHVAPPPTNRDSTDRNAIETDAAPQADITLSLSANKAFIPAHRVPPLYAKLIDAVDEVVITPAKAATWIAHGSEADQRFRMTITPGPSAKDDELVMTIWDWENRAAGQSPVSSAKPQTVEMQVTGRGVYLVTLDGFRKGQHAYRHVRSFAVLPANTDAQARWKQSDYWLGICGFPGRYHWNNDNKPTKPADISEEDARRIEADAMARLGFTIARIDVSMVLPEKETTPINWKRMDAAVEAYTSRGFELALQLMHPPDWAIQEQYKTETKDRWRFPRREEPYRRYVRELVTRYGKHAKFVQVYNEPDQLEFWAASPQEYLAEYRTARDEIRKALPDIPIANGGYAFIDPARTEYFTRELKGEIDMLAYHSHGNLRGLERDVQHMRRLHEEAGYDKPRYINTECGFAAWRLDQERAQAASVVQKILYSWANGDEGMLVFASRMTKAPGRVGRDFGLLDYDFCPRFVYGTVATFIDQLAGAKLESTLAQSSTLHAYLFKRGQDRIVAYFTIGENRPFTITSDAAQATHRDAMGNPLDATRTDRINLTATALVKTLTVRGATQVTLIEGDAD